MSAIICFNDTLSDALFTITISNDLRDASHTEISMPLTIMLVASISFIVLPCLITLIQLSKEIAIWKRVSDDLNAWFSQNMTIVYIASIFMGSSFAAVELFNSNLFNLEIFDMGLSRTQLMGFNVKRIYSLVLLEVQSK